jgi:hypothetical protein
VSAPPSGPSLGRRTNSACLLLSAAELARMPEPLSVTIGEHLNLWLSNLADLTEWSRWLDVEVTMHETDRIERPFRIYEVHTTSQVAGGLPILLWAPDTVDTGVRDISGAGAPAILRRRAGGA